MDRCAGCRGPAKSPPVDFLGDVGQEGRKQLERIEQDLVEGEARPIPLGILRVVQALLCHFQVIIRQVAPEEGLNLALGSGIVVAFEQRGDAPDQALQAGQDPPVCRGQQALMPVVDLDRGR